jgi:hypothetical protein
MARRLPELRPVPKCANWNEPLDKHAAKPLIRASGLPDLG